MRQLLLPAFLSLSFAATAQTAATFDNLTLPGSDTACINYTQPGTDVGFSDGLAYFPSVYDTSFGGYWLGGFAYSNERDTTTGTFANQYAAKTGGGANGSSQYAIYYQPYTGVPKLRLTGAAIGQAARGFYITNTTYAYEIMKDGDPLFGQVGFGKDTANPNDFFKLTVRGYYNGTIRPDSVEFYLADFRSSNPANDYIVKDWVWLPLTTLGRVDSLDFLLSSSRNNGFGSLIPSYFAMDNFTTDETNTGIKVTPAPADVKVFPNPAVSTLTVQSRSADVRELYVSDMGGRRVLAIKANGKETEVDLSALVPGMYQLSVVSESGVAVHSFIKQ